MAGEHDLVVVAAPNRAHVPLARAAIEKGLAVVVDKPLAPSAAEGRALVRAADAAGVMLTVFQNRRWDGDLLTLQRLISDGVLGPVVRFESRFERWRPEVNADAWRERDAPEDAGGLLFDLGSHLVDQAMVLFGRPISVYAEVDRRRPGARWSTMTSSWPSSTPAACARTCRHDAARRCRRRGCGRSGLPARS